MTTKPTVSEETKTAFEFGFEIVCYDGSAIRFINRMFDPAVSAMPICNAGKEIEEVYNHLRETAEIIDGNFFKEFYGDTETGDFDFVYSSWSGKSEVRFFNGMLEVKYNRCCGIYRTREEYVAILKEIGGFGNLDFVSEKFPNKTISEETSTDAEIRRIYRRTIPLARDIAENSTTMRRHLCEFAKKIDAVICTAGVEFAQEDDLWNDGRDVGRRRFYRLAAVKIADWHLVIEEDFSYCENIGVGDARRQDGTRYIRIADASRTQLEEMIEHLPAFLVAYAEELERQNIHFADLRKKAEAILKIVEG